jgi:hypothetical protein
LARADWGRRFHRLAHRHAGSMPTFVLSTKGAQKLQSFAQNSNSYKTLENDSLWLIRKITRKNLFVLGRFVRFACPL